MSGLTQSEVKLLKKIRDAIEEAEESGLDSEAVHDGDIFSTCRDLVDNLESED